MINFVVLAFLLTSFAPTLASYVAVWAHQPYTHGYLVIFAVLWIIWRERAVLRDARALWTAPLLPAAILSVIWLVAAITGVRVVAQMAFPILLLLWCAAVFGRPAALRLAPAMAIFLLAVPFWDFFTRPLQSMTVIMSGTSVSWLGVPAEIEGDVVYIPSGSFLVEGGCSGLNYLMAGLTVGAIYAVAFLNGWRTRLGIVALAGSLAVVGNWIRVATLILIGHATQMQSTFLIDSIPHLLYGWMIFSLGQIVFFLLAGRFARENVPTPSVPSPTIMHPPMRHALPAFFAVAIGPLLYYFFDSLPTREISTSAVVGPQPWRAVQPSSGRPYAWHPAFAGADKEYADLWTDGSSQVVVDRVQFFDQEQGAELIGYTSRIAPDGDVLLDRLLGVTGTEQRLVNEVVVTDSEALLLVWYWFRVGGIETASPSRAKLLEVWSFFRRATPSELIALSARCAPDDCTEAAGVLRSFLGQSPERDGQAGSPAPAINSQG